MRTIDSLILRVVTIGYPCARHPVIRTCEVFNSSIALQSLPFINFSKRCDEMPPGLGLQRLPRTFSIMGPSTEMLARGVAMDLGMRSASQGCFSSSPDVGRSLGFLKRPSLLRKG